MNKQSCELCGNRARMYCDSDQALLCWDCDTKVHCANFLVAKHSRSLLCHSCQSPTPWTASGPKLSPTLSVCTSCLDNSQSPNEETGRGQARSGENDEDYDTQTDDEEEYDSYSEDDEYGNEDAENQVVPLSSSPSITSSPARPVTSSSSHETTLSARDGGATVVVSSPWKRLRGCDCLPSEDEDAFSSDLNNNNLLKENYKGSSSMSFSRPVKLHRTNELCDLN